MITPRTESNDGRLKHKIHSCQCATIYVYVTAGPVTANDVTHLLSQRSATVGSTELGQLMMLSGMASRLPEDYDVSAFDVLG